MKNTAIVTMNPKEIPQVNGVKTIFTPEDQTVVNVANATIIHIPSYVQLGDDVVNLFINRNAELPTKPEFQNMLQFVYFAHMAAFYLSQADYDQVLFEDKDLCDKVLLQFNNQEHYADRVDII